MTTDTETVEDPEVTEKIVVDGRECLRTETEAEMDVVLPEHTTVERRFVLTDEPIIRPGMRTVAALKAATTKKHPNRHARRKAAAIARRSANAGL